MIRHPFLTVLGIMVAMYAAVVVGWNVLQWHRDSGVSVRVRLRDAARM